MSLKEKLEKFKEEVSTHFETYFGLLPVENKELNSALRKAYLAGAYDMKACVEDVLHKNMYLDEDENGNLKWYPEWYPEDNHEKLIPVLEQQLKDCENENPPS